MTYTLDVELFISEVKKYPVIWDMNNENHRSMNRKQAAWAEISKIFIPNFDNMPVMEKDDVYKKLHSKWRNIRDSFVRRIKRKDIKSYMYAKHLSFLNNIYKPGQSDSEGDHNGWSDGETTKLKKLGYNTRQIDLDTWQSDEEVPIDNLKRQISQEAIEYVDTPIIPDAACSFTGEDEDRSFFDSLLPAVRNFNMDQKLEFRSEVLCLVKSIRNNGQKRIKLDPGSGDI